MTTTDFRTEFFQFDGCDIAAGDMIRVKASGPYQRDGFIGRVMYAEYDKDGVLHNITVYGGPGHYASTRTLYAHRFELLGAKEAAKAQKQAEQVAEKMKTTRRTKK